MYSVAVRTAARRVAVAPISRSVVVGKRFTSTVHENDPKVIELEKQRNLRNEQHKTSTPIKNAPGWNQYLASDSEADVKADRSEASLEELTTETVQHINERHHKTEEHIDTESEADVRADHSAATVQDLANGNAQRVHSEERLDAYEASYERDETSGPLKKKGSTKGSA